jgi:bifunctional enzyme CysN/CysC
MAGMHTPPVAHAEADSLFFGLRHRLDRKPLRLLTCGSVDDGKSTLIGRLLIDTGQVFDDQLAALERDSRRYGSELDLSLLLDGPEAKRQQGSTIDVAYRYVSTERRAFIIADAPGDEQYTRSMVTAASNTDLAVLLVDACKGLLTQTRRHALICALLGIKRVALVVNKCDLIDYDRATFELIREEFTRFTAGLGFDEIIAIPASARVGDNVVAACGNTPWYEGPSLLEYLENVNADTSALERPFRLSVQLINPTSAEFRGICGTVSSGRIKVSDRVVVYPSGASSVLARILHGDDERQEAQAGDAVSLVLAGDVDVARGDMLAGAGPAPTMGDQFAAHLICFSEHGLLPGRSYLMRIGNRFVSAVVTTIKHRIDVNTGQKLAANRLEPNDIAVGTVFCAAAVPHDAYEHNRDTGAFILIDRFSNETVAAGLVDFDLYRAGTVRPQRLAIDRAVRARLKQQRPVAIWFTGLSGAGKSTIANALETRLHTAGYHTYLLDGDNIRQGLSRDLGFTEADRVENIRRAGEAAKLMVDAGLIVICSLISPFGAERQMVREMFGAGEFVEIFVDTPIDECIRRDPKGLYARALRGEIKNFTGLDSPYEAPERPELRLPTVAHSAEQLAEQVLGVLRRQGIISA